MDTTITKFIKSTNIKVYPSAYRGLNANNKLFNPEARLNSEHNITYNNSLSKIKSYIIDFDNVKNILNINLYGYIFTINNFNEYLNTYKNNYIYAVIKIKERNSLADETSNTDYKCYSLTSYDSNEKNNLDIKQKDETYNFYGLKICIVDNEENFIQNEITQDEIYLKLKDKGTNDLYKPSFLSYNSSDIKNKDTNENINDYFTTNKLEISNNGYIYKKNSSGNYIFWIDNKNNIVNCVNNPQTSITDITDFSGLYINYINNGWFIKLEKVVNNSIKYYYGQASSLSNINSSLTLTQYNLSKYTWDDTNKQLIIKTDEDEFTWKVE